MIDKQKLRQLADARQRRDETKRAADRSEKEYRELEAEVWADMDDLGVRGELKLDLGDDYGEIGFQKNETPYGTVEDVDLARAYFEARGELKAVMATGSTQFAKGRINEIVKECLESGKELPPGLGFYKRRPVKISFKTKPNDNLLPVDDD